MNMRGTLITGMVMLSLVASGCASHKSVDAPSLVYVPDSAETDARDGVAVQTKAIHDKQDLEAYFGQDLMKYSILPVQIAVHNKAYGAPLPFNRDGVRLQGPNGESLTGLSVDQVMDEAKKSYWRTAGWTVAFGIFGAVPSAINITNTNNKMRGDYEKRLIENGIIHPGETREGVMFFSVPKESNSLNGWKMSLLLKDPNQAKTVAVESPLSGTILVRKAESNPDVAKNSSN